MGGGATCASHALYPDADGFLYMPRNANGKILKRELR
jgi:hypothetical protein